MFLTLKIVILTWILQVKTQIFLKYCMMWHRSYEYQQRNELKFIDSIFLLEYYKLIQLLLLRKEPFILITVHSPHLVLYWSILFHYFSIQSIILINAISNMLVLRLNELNLFLLIVLYAQFKVDAIFQSKIKNQGRFAAS